ncbi:MAG: hypothetical protein FJ011_19780, partial [Chloroflexi bacterium]|nr:hypothetical protein [Chloroflexota bacterium]
MYTTNGRSPCTYPKASRSRPQRPTPLATLGRVLMALFLALSATLSPAAMSTPVVHAGNSEAPLTIIYTGGTCADPFGQQFAATGVGLDGVTSGNLPLRVPTAPDAAFVYWSGAANSDTDPGNPGATFNGVSMETPTAYYVKLGGPTAWALSTYAFAYVANVGPTLGLWPGANLIAGSPSTVTHTIANVNFSLYNNGAGLIAVYKEPLVTEPRTTIIASGMDLMEGHNLPAGNGGSTPVVFPFEPAALPRQAQLVTMLGGLVQPGGSGTRLLYKTGLPGENPPASPPPLYDLPPGDYSVAGVNLFNNANGLYWDTYVYTSTITIPAYAKYVILQVESLETTPAARLDWIMQGLNMPLACPKLALTKTQTDPPSGVQYVGNPVTFSVVVTNTGNTDFYTVTLRDQYNPLYLAFKTSTPLLPSVQSTGVLTYTDIVTGTFGPGQAIGMGLVFTATASTNPTTTINYAMASGSDMNNNPAPPVDDQDDVKNVDLDFGDAPDPTYPTLLINNGARHIILPGFNLGQLVDAEPDGQPNPTATGDDISNLPDEDGVTFNTAVMPGTTASITVIASAPGGLLNAWLDFNRDGDWADAGEQIFTDLPLLPGPNGLTFAVPVAASPGASFARFRFSTQAGLSYTGLAPDGEVEDYAVTIAEPLDFGDAPDPTYPTLLASNAARHVIVPGFFLGATVDA